MKCDDFTPIRNVTLWPWPLTPWPWSLLSFGRQVFKLCVKFEQNRTIRCRVIDDLAIFFRRGIVPNSTPQRGLDQTPPNLKRTDLYHRCTNSEALVAICCFVLKWRQLEKEWCRKRGQISHFLTDVKIRGGVGRMLSRSIEYTLPSNLWYTFDGRLLHGV